MEVKLNDKFNKLYNSKIYIDKDNLILELESKSTKYSKKFKLDELQQMHRYFKQSSNLELQYIFKLLLI